MELDAGRASKWVPWCEICGPPSDMALTGDVLRCASCGQTRRAARTPLMWLTGAAGAGKSWVARSLQAVPPSGVLVFDTDALIYRKEADEHAFVGDWLRIGFESAVVGQLPLLIGQCDPTDVERSEAAQLFVHIEIGYLDAPRGLLETRLAARPPWRNWTSARRLAEVRFSDQLRSTKRRRIDGNQPIAQILRDINQWIECVRSRVMSTEGPTSAA
jgi:hypothetical protein